MRILRRSASAWRVRRSPYRRGGRVTSPARSTSSRRSRASASTTFLRACRAAGDVRPAHQACSGSGGGSRTSLSGFGYSEAYTWSLLPRGPRTGRRSRCRSRCRASRPFSGRRCVAEPRSPLRGETSSRQRGRSLSSSRRTSTSRRASGCPTNAWHVGGNRAGRLRTFAKGAVGGLYAALGIEPPFRAAARSALRPVAVRAHRRGLGRWRCATPSCLEGEWSGFELDVDELASCVREPVRVRRRHHVSPGAPGSRVRRPRRRDRGRARRRPRGRPPGRSSGRCAPSTYYRGRPDRASERSRSPSRSRSSLLSAH